MYGNIFEKYSKVADRIAFLSPCVGKVSEFTDKNTGNIIQYNVTYKKLREYLDKNKVNLNNFDKYDFEDIGCNLGFTFSRPGGLRENVEYNM